MNPLTPQELEEMKISAEVAWVVLRRNLPRDFAEHWANSIKVLELYFGNLNKIKL